MTVERSKRPVGPRRMASVARRLLDASTLCALATVSPEGRAYVNTAYFAWDADFQLVWLSHPRARHSQNVRANGSAAVAVFDSTQVWGSPDRGLQLFGDARELAPSDAGEAERLYAERFPRYVEAGLRSYRLYAFRPRRLKLFDEPELGAAVFVTARVTRDGLAWERTERYR